MPIEQQSDEPILYISPNTTVLEFLNAIEHHKVILEEWLRDVLRTTLLSNNTKMLATIKAMRPNKDMTKDIQSGVHGAVIQIVEQAPVIQGISTNTESNRIPMTRFSGNFGRNRKRPPYRRGV